MSCIVILGTYSIKNPQTESAIHVTNSVQFVAWIFLAKCVSDVAFIKKLYSKPL